MSVVRTLLRKELVDCLRDRRTLVIMLVLPMLLYPALLWGMGEIAVAGKARLAKAHLEVAASGPDASTLLAPEAVPPLTRLVPMERLAAEDALRAGRIHAILDAPVGTRRELDEGRQAQVQLLFTQRFDKSLEARERMRGALRAAGVQVAARRLEARGLPGTFAEPLRTIERDVDLGANLGPLVASRLLPILLIVMLFMGSFYAAIDVTAGEKERGTLETLLVAPVRPVQVMAAKYVTVALVGVIAAGANLAAMALTFGAGLRIADGASVSVALDSRQVAMLVASLLPAACLVSALSLFTASLARTFKEAQNLMTPLMLVGVTPGLAVQMPGLELSAATAWVPLLNVSLAVKAVALGTARWGQVGVVALVSAVLAAAAVWLAARAFDSEALRFGGADSWRDLLPLRRR